MTNQGSEQDTIEVLLDELDTDPSPQEKTQVVGSVCFGKSPVGGDYRCYVIESAPGGQNFALWIETSEEDEVVVSEYADAGEPSDPPPLYALQARFTTTVRRDSAEAARRLLAATWDTEVSTGIWGTTFDEFTVESGGVLREEEIRDIATVIARRYL